MRTSEPPHQRQMILATLPRVVSLTVAECTLADVRKGMRLPRSLGVLMRASHEALAAAATPECATKPRASQRRSRRRRHLDDEAARPRSARRDIVPRLELNSGLSTLLLVGGMNGRPCAPPRNGSRALRRRLSGHAFSYWHPHQAQRARLSRKGGAHLERLG